MMIRFGNLTLQPLEVTDIEMVRQWRNDPKIANHMFFQDYITKEMQQKWFASLDKKHDHYFIVSYNNNPIGLNHVNKIDETTKTGTVGLFIYEESYWATTVAVQASFSLLYYCFEHLGLHEVIAKVKPNNKAAIDYNLNLGFSYWENDLYRLNAARFHHHTKQLIERLKLNISVELD